MKKYIVFIAIVFGIFYWNVLAQSKSEQLKNNKKKIEAEISNTQKLLNETKKNKNASLQQIQVLRTQIFKREELITAINNEILRMEEELALNVKLLSDLDKKLEYMKSDYSRVVYLAFKNRKTMDKLTFLLASENFSQMFRRMKYYVVFAKNVKHQVALIHQTKEEISKKNLEIVSIKEEKLALLEGKEQEVKKLELDRNEKTKTAEQLKKKESQLAADLKAKQARRNELDRAIKNAIQEEIRAANAKKAKESSKSTASKPSSGSSSATPAKSNEIILTPEEALVSNSFVSNKGKLPWPVIKGAKISDFGKYPHPDVPSVIIENRGIDILVEAGTAVRSIFEGEVSGILDVMGTKVLMIRHGEYLSVYQNLATVSVKKGDKVNIKQNIGTIAKTANSSTYELHFEVWKNNTYLNPNHWLTAR